jgi:hypothetical protein
VTFHLCHAAWLVNQRSKPSTDRFGESELDALAAEPPRGADMSCHIAVQD